MGDMCMSGRGGGSVWSFCPGSGGTKPRLTTSRRNLNDVELRGKGILYLLILPQVRNRSLNLTCTWAGQG